MNHELAKELSGAGFVQFGSGNALVLYPLLPEMEEGERPMASIPWCRFVTLKKEGNPEVFYAPTLEELIEACGEAFHLLKKEYAVSKWLAVGIKDVPDDYEYTNGATPEEAVARLWLALSKERENTV